MLPVQQVGKLMLKRTGPDDLALSDGLVDDVFAEPLGHKSRVEHVGVDDESHETILKASSSV